MQHHRISPTFFFLLFHVKTKDGLFTGAFQFRSAGVTDSGISAITNGCPILQMINLSYCNDITDSSLISLAKCSNINTFEVRGCPLITSVGLAAIAVGCRKLVKLDIKKCNSINDVAMIPLAHFSQNLRQVSSPLKLYSI